MSEKLIKIQFPDGKIKEFLKGITVERVVESISSSLKKNAVVAKVDGKLVDLSYKLEKDAELSVLSLDSEEGLHVLRHSLAHVLAQAVKRIYGNVKLGIGPVIEDGFYYDFALERSLTSDDLLAIEKEMENIINENLEIKRIEVPSLSENRKNNSCPFHRNHSYIYDCNIKNALIPQQGTSALYPWFHPISHKLKKITYDSGAVT